MTLKCRISLGNFILQSRILFLLLFCNFEQFNLKRWSGRWKEGRHIKLTSMKASTWLWRVIYCSHIFTIFSQILMVKFKARTYIYIAKIKIIVCIRFYCENQNYCFKFGNFPSFFFYVECNFWCKGGRGGLSGTMIS